MLGYLIRRMLYMIVVVVCVSVLTFVIVQLPPGDFLTERLRTLQGMGQVGKDQVEALRRQYGLDKPIVVQYIRWVGKMLRGDLGYSFHYQAPVWEVVRSRFGYSIVLAILSAIVSYSLAIPCGIISALWQHSVIDYVVTLISFILISVPNFLLGIGIMWFAYKYFGVNIGGMFSIEWREASWCFSKLVDFLAHLWPPLVAITAGNLAGVTRVVRATMLDEIRKPYVTVGRAKGLSEIAVLIKYPIRVALNPIISTIGYVLPSIVSSGVVVGIIFDLPTLGPALWQGSLTQDMYLVGGCILILTVFLVIGTLVSDILLALSDPRIRFE